MRLERLIMSDPRIEKLPVWARDYIRTLERERDAAQDSLNRFNDEQTKTDIFYDKSVIGMKNARHTCYIQGDVIKFNLGDPNKYFDHIQVSMNKHNGEKCLYINCPSGVLSINPASSNSIYVGNMPR